MKTVFYYRRKQGFFLITICIICGPVALWRLYETISFSPTLSYTPEYRFDPLVPFATLLLLQGMLRDYIRIFRVFPDLMIDNDKVWHFREFLPKRFARDRITSIEVQRGGTEWINTENIYFRDAKGKRLTKVEFHHLDADIDEFIAALGDQAALVTFEGEFRHKDRHTGTFSR